MVLACIKPFSNLLKFKFLQVHPVDEAKIMKIKYLVIPSFWEKIG